MYRYIKHYDIGYKNGLFLAIKDSLLETKRRFRILKSNDLRNILYSIGYIDGYSNIEKLTLNIKKNIV